MLRKGQVILTWIQAYCNTDTAGRGKEGKGEISHVALLGNKQDTDGLAEGGGGGLDHQRMPEIFNSCMPSALMVSARKINDNVV
jgi:hypothetical protein